MSGADHARVCGAWLEAPGTRAVFAAISSGGHTARAVGGTVRNGLLGLPVTDIDIATDASPVQVIELTERAGLKTIPTGLQHGTVTVIAHGTPHEVTTLRRDVVTDGRHAVVEFTCDWHADASRRDFTVNAIYCEPDGTIFDPLGGIADLTPLRIRFIGDPVARIREDFLRILRFFRFTAQLTADGMLDAAGLEAARAEKEGLARISGERIADELGKLLAASHAARAAAEMATSGIFASAVGVCGNSSRLERVVQIEKHIGAAPDTSRRLAALLVDNPADATRVVDRLKLSSGHKKRVLNASEPSSPPITRDASPRQARALCYRLGADDYLDKVVFAWAETRDDAVDPVWTKLADLPARWSTPEFPIRGSDLLAMGLSPGKAIGEILTETETSFIASDFTLGREDLLALARTMARTTS